MILYDYCRSSAAYRVRIALNLKKMPYEQVPVSLLAGEHVAEEHLSRNPQGLVPALQDGEVMLTQSLAICEYLDDAYPQSQQLLPADAIGKAKVRAMAQLIACDIHPVNNLRILKYLVAEQGVTDEEKTTWYQHWIYKGFNALEHMLSGSDATGDFCYGDQPTLADLCLVPQVFNANRFKCDMSRYPNIVRINDNCVKANAFAEAHPDLQPGA